MTSRVFVWLPLLGFLACGAPATDPAEATATEAPAESSESPPASSPAVDAEAEQRARMAMNQLGGTLKSALVSTMKAEGSVAAMSVCSTSAQAMTAEVARERGVTVGRSSLRLRNPRNVAPDWVRAWLSEQGERPAEGVQGATRSATLDDGTAVVRVVAPLAVEAPCLVCHGPDATRAPELTAALAERYPTDQATGYQAGDLRGAIWAEAKVSASQ